MTWYLTLAASAFCAGVGWRAATFLCDALESFLLDGDDFDDFRL